MRDSPGRILCVCVALSTMLHVSLAAVWQGPSAVISETIHSDDKDSPPQTPRATLGIAESTVTSITWIGSESPTPHAAETGEVDQPELAMVASASPPVDSPMSAADAATPPEIRAASVDAAADGETEIEAATVDVMPDAVLATTPDATATADSSPPSASEGAEPAPPTNEQPMAPPLAEQPTTARDAPELTERGEPSDRESDATSRMTADLRKPGRPLAGQGLEVRTRRPRFTYYTRVMGSRASPVFRVYFRKDGGVERVETLESSGNPDVDRPVIDAIFEWRAEGEAIKRLPDTSPPATLPIEFRVIL